MGNIVFAYPAWFLLFILFIPIIGWYVFRNRKSYPTLQVSSVKPVENSSVSYKIVLGHVLFALKMIGMALMILALARPQSTDSWENQSTMGIDIVLALDVSSSMLAQDFKPDRLEAAKNMAIEFISGRPNDRIGLVVFSGESFTQCPLTTDHAVLINLFKDIKSGMIEDGTAIGVGLANAVKRLKDSQAISKVIILMTDGVNNEGAIDPITAAELAKTYGIRVYTIGIGTMGTAPYPVQDMFGHTVLRPMKVEIDEPTLQHIADITDGRYFRATNNDKLREIYQEIDQLEKSKISVKQYSRKNEKFLIFAIPALALLLFEFLIRKTVLRSIP